MQRNRGDLDVGRACRSRGRRLWLGISGLLLASATLAQVQDAPEAGLEELPRRPFLGVRMTTAPEGQVGVLVQTVFPRSSAAAADLRAGDVLEAMAGAAVARPADILERIPRLRVGDAVPLSVRRESGQLEVRLVLTPFPEEAVAGATVRYGSVADGERRLRTLLSLPRTGGEGQPAPAVMLLQGIDCSSIEQTFSPRSAWAQLIARLTEVGFATYRVEKAGVGDSTGGPCRDNDFRSETSGFAAGLRALAQEKDVDPERIYLMGFSMGGVWAPLLALEQAVGGIAAYGTIARPFQEYLLENRRRQDLLAGVPPGEIEEATELDARLFHFLFARGESPQEILDRRADLADAVRQKMSRAETPVRHLYADRTAPFLRQIHETNISAAWDQVRVPVLALWGAGDYVSARADHELIARIVNANGAGLGQFDTVPADHWLGEAPSEEAAYRARREGSVTGLSAVALDRLVNWARQVDEQAQSG